MTPSPAKRPAHRPSRRDDIVGAAVDLFAERPPADVTIADIADRAGMTSAAVYYHFPAKDDVLLEALRGFSEDLVAHVRALTQPGEEEDPVQRLVDGFLEWVEERRTAAKVFFVSSVGSTPAAEALRRDIRNRLTPLIAGALRRSLGVSARTQSAVNGLALLSLFETAAAAMLADDETYRTMGARGFRDRVHELAGRIVGAAA